MFDGICGVAQFLQGAARVTASFETATPAIHSDAHPK